MVLKTKLIITFASIMTYILVVASCTNSEFMETANLSCKSYNISTRHTEDITMEEVKSRLATINNKYGTNFIIDENVSAYEYNDFFFISLENLITKTRDVENHDTSYNLDDSTLDKMSITFLDTTFEETYEAELTQYEELHSENISIDFSPIIQYEWITSYKVKYGRYSLLENFDFQDITSYNWENMEDGNRLQECEIEQYAETYELSYIPGYLDVSPVIYYNKENPQDKESISFGYSYRIAINNNQIQVITVHNSSATAYNLICE